MFHFIENTLQCHIHLKIEQCHFQIEYNDCYFTNVCMYENV